MQPDRAPLRWLPLQAGLVAAALAALIATAVALVALPMEAPLERVRAAGQRAVLDLLAGEIDRAIELGIPLAALPDLQTQLEAALERLADLSAVEIAMPDGFRAAAGTVGPGDVPATAALGGGSLTLYRVPDGILQRGLWAAAAATALVAGLGAAALASILVCRPARRAEAALADRLAGIAGGDFATPPAAAAGLPADDLAAELEELRARVVQRRRQLDRQAAGARAIDFDGSIAPRVDAILARIDRDRRFPDPGV